MRAKELPTQAELLDLFDYDAESGVVIRKVSVASNAPAGAVVGMKSAARGGYTYLTVQINLQRYKLHRVIWKMVHGVDPEHHIDHINGNTLDNRIENLRDATHQENLLNCHFHRSAAA